MAISSTSVPEPRSATAELNRTGSLVTFFVLSYAVMWSCFITVAVAVPASTLLGGALLLVGAFAPALGSVVDLRRVLPGAYDKTKLTLHCERLEAAVR